MLAQHLPPTQDAEPDFAMPILVEVVADNHGHIQCFARRKMFDLAAKTLQTAIKEKPVFDDEKKELIYNLGSVLEGMDNKEQAIEQFKLIYEVDIGYRDVAKKVDDYYAGQ